MVAVLGVDPGVNGGLAVLDDAGRPVFVQGIDDQMTEDQVVEITRQAVTCLVKHNGYEGYFEKVQHMTGDGAQGSHTFGYIKGLLRGAIKARGVVLHDVPPQLWQAKLDCLSGGNKRVTKARAIELFPGVKVTHKTADALLIALFGRLSSMRRGAR